MSDSEGSYAREEELMADAEEAGRQAALSAEAATVAAGPDPNTPEVKRERIKTFDPRRYLTKVGKADYLEVKYRLVWLRDIDPEAVIETLEIDDDGQRARYRARVTLTTGGSSTGHGTETMDDFNDYAEKAETKAVGRALAMLGFGTQFTAFELDARIVDAPVDLNKRSNRAPQPRNQAQSGTKPQTTQNAPQAATGGQTAALPGNAPLINLEQTHADQTKNWNLAVDHAIKIGDATQGTVVPEKVRAAWVELRNAAIDACKRGKSETNSPVPVQRWRFYRVVANAPTINFLAGLETEIENLAAWDDILTSAVAKRRQELNPPDMNY